jgi:hypothetical protein
MMAVLVVVGAVLARPWFALRGGEPVLSESVLTGAAAVAPSTPD